MRPMNVIENSFKKLAAIWGIGMLVVLGGCSSSPEPPPEPSKKEIRQDSDRFFNKMGREESQNPTTP